MKASFFDYIGPEKVLGSYSRSYKLVFLKCFFALMDNKGQADTFEVAERFRSFYAVRIHAGKIPDKAVDERIQHADTSTIADVLQVIMGQPYRVIHNKGYMDIVNRYDRERFALNAELYEQLTKEDYTRLQALLNSKLELYYTRIGDEEQVIDLREAFNKLLHEYYICRTTQSLKQNSMVTLISNTIPELLQASPSIDAKRFVLKGSAGMGNWASTPWVCIFNKGITITAQDGVYIVYLLSEDGQTLSVSLNQGCTKLRQTLGSAGAIAALEKVSEKVRIRLTTPRFSSTGLPKIGNVFYEKGAIFFKEYQLDAIPSNEELYEDLSEMIHLYDGYYHEIFLEIVDSIPEALPLPPEETSLLDEPLQVDDEVARIANYIASKGFTYEPGMIENLYLCLKAKPFVIMAGTSGTGKTRLVKLFAQAMGATAQNGRYKLVPVHPDWSDSSDLLGHVDLNGRFVPGAIIDFVKSACEDLSNPYFLCLDEMNLARVEHYFSDILSIIETRQREGDRILTDPLITDTLLTGDAESRRQYTGLYLPENMYLIGTVNMDETTFPFSKKVLDRANTIEFSFVNLDMPEPRMEEPEIRVLSNGFLKSEYLLASDCIGYEELLNDAIALLKRLNELLKPCNSQIGYRIRDEICFYLAYNRQYGLLGESQAMDHAILQKILPRIQGSNMGTKSLLIELFKLCADDQNEIYQNAGNMVADTMFTTLKRASLLYPKSAEKLAFMTRRFEDDGFTSYWV